MNNELEVQYTFHREGGSGNGCGEETRPGPPPTPGDRVLYDGTPWIVKEVTSTEAYCEPAEGPV